MAGTATKQPTFVVDLPKRRVSAAQPSFTRPCPTCGRDFKVFASTAARGSGKFCSPACRPRTGSANPKWRGGRIKQPDGRVIVYAPEHPGANQFGGKYIYEYRLIAEQKIGRLLTADEIVHHVNGNHLDNRPENLAVMTQAEHARIHLAERRKTTA